MSGGAAGSAPSAPVQASPKTRQTAAKHAAVVYLLSPLKNPAVSPAHINMMAREELSYEERDFFRAEYVGKTLRKMGGLNV